MPKDVAVQIDFHDHIKAGNGDEQSLLIQRNNVVQIVEPWMGKMMDYVEVWKAIDEDFRLGTDIELVLDPARRLEDEGGIESGQNCRGD